MGAFFHGRIQDLSMECSFFKISVKIRIWQLTSILSKNNSCQVLEVQLEILILTFHRPCVSQTVDFSEARAGGPTSKILERKNIFHSKKAARVT